jgi:hypothetical protein
MPNPSAAFCENYARLAQCRRAGGLAVEYAFTELEYALDGPVAALLAWTAANADAVRRSQAEFDRSRHMDDVT